MVNGIVEFLGWFGAVTVLAGYLLFSTGRLPNGPAYQLFNLVGGLAVAINVAAHHAVPSTIVNGIWALVAFVVLVRTARGRRVARRAARRGTPTEPLPPVAETAAHVEPPATTAVLPVIGPALRNREEPSPEVERTPTTGSIPLVESVPVITAAIAVALVAAAQEHSADDARTQDRPAGDAAARGHRTTAH